MIKNLPSDDSHTSDAADAPDSRRQFLQSASAVAGALLLNRVPAGAATAGASTAPGATTLNLSEHPRLAKAGGFEIVEVNGERVIVAHTASGFSACSAKCPHRGCDVEYRLADKQFVCPCHNSRFDEAGKVLKGPAKTDLKLFDAAQAIVVKPR